MGEKRAYKEGRAVSTFPTCARLPQGSEPSASSASREEGLLVQCWARASEVAERTRDGAQSCGDSGRKAVLLQLLREHLGSWESEVPSPEAQ